MIPPTWIMLLLLWVFGFVMLVYGLIGLKKGKIRAYGRGVSFGMSLSGGWAKIYSAMLVILGGGLLAGLIYNAINCGMLSLCE